MKQNQEQVSVDMRCFINKSGTYYAEVSFYDIKTQMPYSVYSDEVNYTRPSKCMVSPSEVKWDENIATWSPVDEAIGYRIGLYKVTNYTYSYENADLNTGSYTKVEIANGTECRQLTSLKLAPADKATREVWNKQLVVYYDDADQEIKAYINGWDGKANTFRQDIRWIK